MGGEGEWVVLGMGRMSEGMYVGSGVEEERVGREGCEANSCRLILMETRSAPVADATLGRRCDRKRRVQRRWRRTGS